jgi:hypothetical protein
VTFISLYYEIIDFVKVECVSAIAKPQRWKRIRFALGLFLEEFEMIIVDVTIP